MVKVRLSLCTMEIFDAPRYRSSSTSAAAPRNVPFARPEVTHEQELPGAIAAAGLSLDDVSEVVITHAHGDHINGLAHARGAVLINETELRFLRSPMPRVMRRLLRQPLP